MGRTSEDTPLRTNSAIYLEKYYCENIHVERETPQSKFVYYIAKKTLIDMFQSWVFEFNLKKDIRIKRSTLLTKFEECGFECVGRKRIHKKQLRVFKFTEHSVQTAIHRMYPTLPLENWLCELEPETFLEKIKEYEI